MTQESHEELSVLPYDIIGEIITRSSSVSRVEWCYVSKTCYLYVLKTVKHIGSYSALRYECIKGDILSVMRGPALYSHVDGVLREAVRNGHIDLVKFLKSKTSFNVDDYSLEIAYTRGFTDIIELFKDIALNYNQVMYKVCVNGSLELVKDCVSKINESQVAGLLYAAAKHKHYDIVSFLLEHFKFSFKEMMMVECVRGRLDKVLDMILPDFVFDNMYLSTACISGNINLIKHLLSISQGIANLNIQLATMCEIGNLQMAKLLVENGARFTSNLYPLVVGSGNIDFVRFVLKDNTTNLIELFSRACTDGNVEIMKIISEHGRVDWNEAIKQGCFYGHRNIVEYALKNVTWNGDWNTGLINSCRRGDEHLMKLMLEKGADDYDNAMISACGSGNVDCIKKMIRLGARHYEAGLVHACDNGQIDAAKLMLTYGAKLLHRIERSGYPELMKLVQDWSDNSHLV